MNIIGQLERNIVILPEIVRKLKNSGGDVWGKREYSQYKRRRWADAYHLRFFCTGEKPVDFQKL